MLKICTGDEWICVEFTKLAEARQERWLMCSTGRTLIWVCKQKHTKKLLLIIKTISTCWCNWRAQCKKNTSADLALVSKFSESTLIWHTHGLVLVSETGFMLTLWYNNIHRGYYMAARRYEISLRVLKNISRVSAANEWNIFQHEKRNFVSPSGHVMFYLLYKHQWNAKPFHFNTSFLLRKARCIM